MKPYMEIWEHREPGFQPLVRFEGWRVALYNFTGGMGRENIGYMERHNRTDEVFVLLQGECSLYVGEGTEPAEKIRLIPMEPRKLYNVKKSVWHNVAGKPGSTLLIVENADTSSDNTDRIGIAADQLPTE